MSFLKKVLKTTKKPSLIVVFYHFLRRTYIHTYMLKTCKSVCECIVKYGKNFLGFLCREQTEYTYLVCGMTRIFICRPAISLKLHWASSTYYRMARKKNSLGSTKPLKYPAQPCTFRFEKSLACIFWYLIFFFI